MHIKHIERVEIWEIPGEIWDWLIEVWPYDGDVPDILVFDSDSEYYAALYHHWENDNAPDDKEIFDTMCTIISALDFVYGHTEEFKLSWQKEDGAQFVVEDRESGW